MMRKQLLLITPSAIVARGLEQVCARLGEFEVASILSDLPSQSAGASQTGLDGILVDPRLLSYADRGRGRELLSAYDCAVLAIETMPLDEGTRRQYDGVIHLDDTPPAIIQAIRQALSERNENSSHAEGEELTAREREILICVAGGMLNKEIADHLGLSIHTVISHRKNIARKTGIKTVAGLTVYAMMNGLIDTMVE